MTMTKIAMMAARMAPMIIAAMYTESLSTSAVGSSGPENCSLGQLEQTSELNCVSLHY